MLYFERQQKLLQQINPDSLFIQRKRTLLQISEAQKKIRWG